MRKIQKLKKQISVAIKKGDLSYKIVCFFLMKIGFSNEKLQTLEVRNKVFRYLKKKYSLKAKGYRSDDTFVSYKQKRIWILWLQGIEVAPTIVKKCYESVCKYNVDMEVILLDENNFLDYTNIPQYIIDKWKNGIITNTHMSDIIRSDLLVRNGGIWVDATTYFTGPLPDYIVNTEFFVYKHSTLRDITVETNSWLISSSKNIRLMIVVRDLLFEYWKSENKVREYFLWHLFVKISIEEYPEDWEKVFYVPDDIPEMLRWNLFKQIDEGIFEEICKMTPIHKLSYKIDIPEKISGTIYEYILNNGKEQ